MPLEDKFQHTKKVMQLQTPPIYPKQFINTVPIISQQEQGSSMKMGNKLLNVLLNQTHGPYFCKLHSLLSLLIWRTTSMQTTWSPSRNVVGGSTNIMQLSRAKNWWWQCQIIWHFQQSCRFYSIGNKLPTLICSLFI